MAKGVNIPLTISGLREARENLERLNDEFEKVKNDPIESKKIAKEFNQLSDAIDKTTEELVKMNAAGELAGTKFDDLNEVLFNTKEEVLPLTSQIGEMEDRLYQLAAANKQGSKEFQVLQQKVVAARKTIIETDRAIDTMAENAGSLGGITSAFGELGESVLSLDFKRAGVALKGLGTQFKAFGATLLANPIFLIVAVVAAIVTAVVSLKDKVKVLGVVFDFFAGIVNDAIQALKDFLDWIGLTNFAEQDLAEQRADRAKEYLDFLDQQSSKFQSDMDRQIALANAEGKNTVELEKQKQKEIEVTNRKRMEALLFLAKQEQIAGTLTEERAKEIKKLFDDANEARKNAINQQKIIDATEAKDRRERAKERKAEKDKELEEDKERIRQFNEFRKQAELEWLAEEEELSELIYQAGLSDQERELSALDEHYFNVLERARQHGLDVTALEQEYANKKAEIDQKYADQKAAIDKEIFSKVLEQQQKELQEKQAVEEAKVNLVSQGLKLATELTALFADKSEKAAKIAFNVQKVASIAQATMDGYKAVLSTYAQTPGGPVLKGIAAGIAGSFAAIQIANIAKTKFEGGGSGAAVASSASSIGGGGASSSASGTPSFELFGRPNEGNNVESAKSADATPQMTVKAVVVESDITSTQNKINKIQKSAEL